MLINDVKEVVCCCITSESAVAQIRHTLLLEMVEAAMLSVDVGLPTKAMPPPKSAALLFCSSRERRVRRRGHGNELCGAQTQL